MEGNFVKIRFDVHCEWYGFPPDYRIYVNDELFAERTYKVDDTRFIKEMLQISAPPGIYEVRFEPIEPKTGKFIVGRLEVEVGRARIIDDKRFEIV